MPVPLVQMATAPAAHTPDTGGKGPRFRLVSVWFGSRHPAAPSDPPGVYSYMSMSVAGRSTPRQSRLPAITKWDTAAARLRRSASNSHTLLRTARAGVETCECLLFAWLGLAMLPHDLTDIASYQKAKHRKVEQCNILPLPLRLSLFQARPTSSIHVEFCNPF